MIGLEISGQTAGMKGLLFFFGVLCGNFYSGYSALYPIILETQSNSLMKLFQVHYCY
jgi:hypothetical protein